MPLFAGWSSFVFVVTVVWVEERETKGRIRSRKVGGMVEREGRVIERRARGGWKVMATGSEGKGVLVRREKAKR